MTENITVKIKYKKDFYKYQLQEDYKIYTSIYPAYKFTTKFFSLDENGALTINAGYAWDGATGIPDRKSIMRGSLIHDVLYQMMREGFLNKNMKKDADEILYKLCIMDGTNKLWAYAIYKGVRLFGNPFIDPSKNKPTLEAP